MFKSVDTLEDTCIILPESNVDDSSETLIQTAKKKEKSRKAFRIKFL